MRILITSTGSFGTGSFFCIEAIVREFIEAGHQVKVLMPSSAPQTVNKNATMDKNIYIEWKFPIKNNR